MHARSFLREAFQEYLDSGTPAQAFRFEDNGKEKSLDWLLGQLWRCTDILPGDYCDQLQLRRGSNYAQAVRQLKRRPDMHLPRSQKETTVAASEENHEGNRAVAGTDATEQQKREPQGPAHHEDATEKS